MARGLIGSQRKIAPGAVGDKGGGRGSAGFCRNIAFSRALFSVKKQGEPGVFEVYVVSNRPRYGLHAGRDKPGFGRPAAETAWPSWGEMRPVLLKSAGIVGLAAAIMVVVSGNALFVDPGGPHRDSATSANGEPGGLVVAATGSGTLNPSAPETQAAVPMEAAAVAMLEAEPPAAPAMVASIKQAAEPPPAAESLPEPAVADTSAEAVAAPSQANDGDAAPSEAALPDPAPVEDKRHADEIAVPEAEAPTSVGPAVVSAPVVSAPNAPRVADAAPAETPPSGADAAAWPRQAVDCPRDWVAVDASGQRAMARPGCDAGATVAATAPAEPSPLPETLPDHLLELAALAPPIPVPPSPDAGATPAAASTAAAAVPPSPPKKPSVRAASHASDWPSDPPPDCAGKHAYWRFVENHHGSKEWYCK